MKLVVLIPAYNEAETILETIAAVERIRPRPQIVVINDGSTDKTAELVQSCSDVLLLELSKNQGKGGALNYGWQNTTAEIYLLLDGDLGNTANLAQALVDPIYRNEAEMTIAKFGSKQSKDKRKMGFGLVRRFASLGILCLTGTYVQSPLSGQRAIKAEVLTSLGGFFPGFEVEVGLTLGALRNGYRIVEIPLAMSHRAYGRGFAGIKHRLHQLRHVIKALWRGRKGGRCS